MSADYRLLVLHVSELAFIIRECVFCNELLVVNDHFKVQGHEKQRKVVLWSSSIVDTPIESLTACGIESISTAGELSEPAENLNQLMRLRASSMSKFRAVQRKLSSLGILCIGDFGYRCHPILWRCCHVFQ